MKAFNALRGRLKRPSASMIIALVALFVALGGGAYATVATQSRASCPQQGRALGVDHPEHHRLRRG